MVTAGDLFTQDVDGSEAGRVADLRLVRHGGKV
jgi:hypothetical protein